MRRDGQEAPPSLGPPRHEFNITMPSQQHVFKVRSALNCLPAKAFSLNCGSVFDNLLKTDKYRAGQHARHAGRQDAGPGQVLVTHVPAQVRATLHNAHITGRFVMPYHGCHLWAGPSVTSAKQGLSCLVSPSPGISHLVTLVTPCHYPRLAHLARSHQANHRPLVEWPMAYVKSIQTDVGMLSALANLSSLSTLVILVNVVDLSLLLSRDTYPSCHYGTLLCRGGAD